MNNASDVNLWGRACRMREARREMERLHSRMQHRNGVAVSVLADAERILDEIWESCQDPRTPDQILAGVWVSDDPCNLPAGGWSELREKLYLLQHYLDYSVQLLEADGTEIDDSTRSSSIRTPQ